MTSNIKSLHTPFRKQMRMMELWLRHMIQTESKKNTLGQQVDIMMGVWSHKRNEIEDGYDALLGSKVKIRTREYEEDGNDDLMEFFIEELQQYDPLTFITLSLYLPQIKEIEGVKHVIDGTDLYGTFDLYSQKIKSQHEQYRRRDLLDNADNLRWNCEVVPPKPGFQWEVISTGTFRNNQTRYIRGDQRQLTVEKCQLPHIGIYASATAHPKWVKAMNAGKIPYVWVAGLDVKGADGLWDLVSEVVFFKHDRAVWMYAVSDDYQSQGWSVAVVREYLHFGL
jgi:hypothetical protein